MVLNLLNGRAILPWLAAFVALMVAVPSWAQTTGQLRVTVFDDGDLEVGGVALRLEGENLIGGAQERSTDGYGQFFFTELPPGIYRIEATHPAFRGVTIDKIAIDVSRTKVLRIDMVAGEPDEEIFVTSKRQAVDVESTTRSQVLTKEFLSKIPAGRSYQTAVTFAAGVQESSGGNPNIGGASNENTYMLDGVNITDPVTGTFSLNFNFDAIQQIEVLLGGYMPEYGTSVGGIINVVTESGTNNLVYNTSVYYNNGNLRPRKDERVTADGFTLAPTGFDSTFQSIQVGAKISGPVVRDKAWFIISYQAARSIIANTGIPQARDFDGHYMLAKLTVQPSTEHRFAFFIQTNPTNIDNIIQNDPFTKAEAQQTQVQGGYVVTGKWQWFLSPEINLDTTAFLQKIYLEGNSVPCTHDRDRDWSQCRPTEAEGEVDWETPGRFGTFGAYNSVNSLQFFFDDRLRYSLSSKLSLLSVDDPLGGTHDFKFGVEGIQLIWDQIQGVNGNQYFVDLNEVTFDPNSFQNWYWFETTGPIKFRVSSSQYNMFAQDSWKPVSNLTLNYGMRFDSFVLRNDLGEPVLTGGLFGPRLFGSWDPFKNQKTKIATGYGRFNDTGRLGVASYTSASGYGQKLYLGEFTGDTEGAGFLNDQRSVWFDIPRENLNIAHDNLRNPRVDEIILVLEREIVEDVALYSQMSGKFSRFMFEPDDVNRIWDSDGSAVIGSRLSDPLTTYGRLRTPALAKRDYYQWDLGVRKVESRRWAAEATYTYTNAVGSTQQALSGSFLIDPQTQFNYGQLNIDRRHSFKSLAYWNLPTDPWTQSLSLAFVYFDGFPIDRLYYSDTFQTPAIRIRPRGTYYRFNPYWYISLGFRQDIDVRKGKFIVSLDAQNVFNNRAPDFLSTNFINIENRLLTVSRQDPLRLQFGLAYEF